MGYLIKQIIDKTFIDECELFQITNFNWGGDYRPVTKGRLALVKGKGFFLQMICQETNPVRRYENTNDPVYTDSCMEAFINFYPHREGSGYLNFEMNANGALLSQYGTGRKNRIFLTDLGYEPPKCHAAILKDAWSVELLIPFDLIEQVYGISTFNKDDMLSLNFFKVGETADKSHFASYSPIVSDQPDFHLPNFFTEGIIV